MLDFCKCGRLLTSPEELTHDVCRYCFRGIEASTTAFFETFRATMSYVIQSTRRRAIKSIKSKPKTKATAKVTKSKAKPAKVTKSTAKPMRALLKQLAPKKEDMDTELTPETGKTGNFFFDYPDITPSSDYLPRDN